MPHEMPLIATIVAGPGLAFVFGAFANRFRIPPLVGFLIAGVIVRPHTPGFVADQHLALELAEIGVILLMFGVGLHFSLNYACAAEARLARQGSSVDAGTGRKRTVIGHTDKAARGLFQPPFYSPSVQVF